VELLTEFSEISLGKGQTCPFGPDIWSVRLLFRQLRKAILRTLDFQLIEIPNGKVEKHSPSNISIAGCLEKTIRSQLVTIGLETPSLVKGGGTEVMLNHPEKTRAHQIVIQQLEEAAHQSRLTPVHELERSTVGILGSENRVISEHPPSPGRIVKLAGVRDPREFDFNPPVNERRHTFNGAIDQSVHCIRLAASAPAFFVKGKDCRFGNRAWCDVEMSFFWKLAPDSRAIVERVEPTGQSLALVDWNGVDDSPCAADVIYRKTGLGQERPDSMAERSWRNYGKKVTD